MGWKLNETDQSALGFWFSFFFSNYVLLKRRSSKVHTAKTVGLRMSTFRRSVAISEALPLHLQHTLLRLNGKCVIRSERAWRLAVWTPQKNDSCSPCGRPKVYARICKHQKVGTEMWASNKKQTGNP